MITLMGLGPGSVDALPARAFSLLTSVTSATPLFLRTIRHPLLEVGSFADALKSLPLGTVFALDHFYETASSFEETYSNIVAHIIQQAQTHQDIYYAVPGHPLVGESTVSLLLTEAKRLGIPVRIWGAPSFIDATLEALQEAVVSDLHVLDALLLDPEDPSPAPALRTGQPLLIYQVHSRLVASQTKLALMAAGYPDEYPVTVVRAAGMPEKESTQTLPLYKLDRQEHDHLTSLWVPALSNSIIANTNETKLRPNFDDLVRVMARLRDPETGCPWDIKQTHATLRRYALEEAYEVAEAIDSEDPDALCDELGDLLLQVVFHAQMASEAGDFTIGDVCVAIVEKMIRRHPHIFGNVQADTPDEVLANWQLIKAQEKAEKGIVTDLNDLNHPNNPSILTNISKSLPALSQALEISKRAVKVGFEWPEIIQVLDKVEEEWAELRTEIEAKTITPERIFDELGDVLFTLVNLGRKFDIDAEDALRNQLSRFTLRFQYMESKSQKQSKTLESLTLAEWEGYWQEAKQAEKSAPKQWLGTKERESGYGLKLN